MPTYKSPLFAKLVQIIEDDDRGSRDLGSTVEINRTHFSKLKAGKGMAVERVERLADALGYRLALIPKAADVLTEIVAELPADKAEMVARFAAAISRAPPGARSSITGFLEYLDGIGLGGRIPHFTTTTKRHQRNRSIG